jgi:simple sugar transport system ATP-binding protein
VTHDGAPLLVARELTKEFGHVHALTDVSFELYPSECLAVAGDNGAGKSTLVKILTGVHDPTSGTVVVHGDEMTTFKPSVSHALGIRIVYQDLALADNLSVMENIFLGKEPVQAIGGLLRRVDRASMRGQASEALGQLGVDIDPAVSVSELSGGQRQMVAIARAMVDRPRVVILDEPTAALSVAASEPVLDLVRQLRSTGVGVILISHRMDDIIAVSDRVIVLRHGQLVSTRATAGLRIDDILRHMAGAAS